MNDMLQAGVISSTHGVRGEVKVFPTTDDAKRFSRLKEITIIENGNEQILHIKSVKYFKNMVILSFDEFNSLNEVERLKGKPLYVSRKQAVPLDKDEYFIADLIDMEVIDDKTSLKGVVKDVLQTGANDVYVIELEDKRELLLPAIKDCVVNIDMQKRIMLIHIMEGLL